MKNYFLILSLITSPLWAISYTQDTINKPVDRHDNLPIHIAAKQGTVEDLEILVGWGSLIESVNHWNQTPLIKAVEGGNVAAVGYLLEKGAQLTQERHPATRFNPFHYTVLTDRYMRRKPKAIIAIINLLAEHDPKQQFINMSSQHGTPLELAITNNLSPNIIQALLRNGAQITTQVRKAIKRNPKLTLIFENYEKPIAPGV